ncbi:MAG: AraC family ligand binding domain-containing protein, partial [Bacteroidota bacterium]
MPTVTQFKRYPFFDQLEVLNADGYLADFPLHSHDVVSLTLVRSGVETTRVKGKELRATVGSISLTYPDELHANPNLNGGDYNFTTFYLSPDLLYRLNGGKE